MKGWIPRSVNELIDKLDTNKNNKSYSLETRKNDDEIIKARKDGETWVDSNTNYIINDGVIQSERSKLLDEELKDIRLPRFCPQCNKALKHHLDIDSWWINQKCFDCFIVEDHKFRISDNYAELSKIKDIVETVALLKAERSVYLELSVSVGENLNLVQNSEGFIDTWKVDDEETKRMVVELNKKIIGINDYIDILEKERDSERSKIDS